MNIIYELSKEFPTVREIAQVLWINAILAEELGYKFVIKDFCIFSMKPKPLTKEYITEKVCKYFNMPQEMLMLKTRKREVVQVSQISMFFSKQLTKDSLKKIGDYIGGKDHATVLHANKVVKNLIDTDKRFAWQIDEIEKLLK